MGFKITDLKPKTTTLSIKGKDYTLRPFSLATQVWCYSEFATKEEKNGLVNLGELLKEVDFMAGCKIAYHLLKDKSDFNTVDDFINAIGDYTNLVKVYQAICESIGVSQPHIETITKEAQEKKLEAASLTT